MNQSGTATDHGPRKRRRLSLVAALLAAGLLGGFCYGFLCHRYRLFPYSLLASLRQDSSDPDEGGPSGRWGRARRHTESQALSAEQAAKLEKMTALGYLAGHEAAPADTGVVRYDPQRTYDGYNYYVSGHAPTASLIDMQGNVLHTWHKEFADVWPDESSDGGEPDYWRKLHLYPNGNVLALFDRLGLVMLDSASNVLWSLRLRCHHDLQVTDDGRIYVLTNEFVRHPEIHGAEPVLNDYVVILDEKGEQSQRVSVLDAFLNSPFERVLERIPAREDIFHTNGLIVLDGRLESKSPAFRAGNVLISLREVDLLAVLDPDQERIVWIMWGMWRKQHDPALLDNGRMILFDNQGHYGRSKVIEFDPFAQEPIRAHPHTEFDPWRQQVFWAFEGDAENKFFSRFCGTNQRLPNGNTLITESDSGRVFEVTSDGDTVWEFLNPARAGENDELIAVVFEMVRVGPKFPIDWHRQ